MSSSSSTPPSSATELPIQEAALDLLRWFIPILHRLPRQHRHGLGDRLIASIGRQHSGWLASQP